MEWSGSLDANHSALMPYSIQAEIQEGEDAKQMD
jgi:hypothetical protein